MFRRYFARHSWIGRLFDRTKKSRLERREAFLEEVTRQLRHESLESRTLLASDLGFNPKFSGALVDVLNEFNSVKLTAPSETFVSTSAEQFTFQGEKIRAEVRAS